MKNDTTDIKAVREYFNYDGPYIDVLCILASAADAGRDGRAGLRAAFVKDGRPLDVQIEEIVKALPDLK